MNAAALEADLRALGFAGRVEAREGLALLVPAGHPSGLEDAGVRREAVRLAEARGFTHIAVELPGGSGFAAAEPGAIP